MLQIDLRSRPVNRCRSLGLALCAGTVVMLSWPVYAAEIEGVQFADSYRADTVTMKLSCTGLLRYMYVIKGYVAALYVGDGVQTGDVLADVPKRLELNYFYAIKGEDFGKAGDKILADNIDAETFNRLRPRLQKLNSLYEDVKPGDRYSLTYVPGKGTELALNGKPKGVIEGADFAAAYFAIWLGRRPIDESLRAQLLHCPRA